MMYFFQIKEINRKYFVLEKVQQCQSRKSRIDFKYTFLIVIIVLILNYVFSVHSRVNDWISEKTSNAKTSK